MPVRSVRLGRFRHCGSRRLRPHSRNRAPRLWPVRASSLQPSSNSSATRRPVHAPMFTEIAKVLTHPRCMNCHPAGAISAAGLGSSRAYAAGVARRRGLRRDRHHLLGLSPRRELRSHRGRHLQKHPRPSALGPRAAVDGVARKIDGDICRQVKDVRRNGGRDLALLQEHIAKDDSGRLGLESRPGPRTCAGQPGGRRQIGPGLDR